MASKCSEVNLLLPQKVEILNLLKDGVSAAEVDRRYGVNESTARTIYQAKRSVIAPGSPLVSMLKFHV